MHALVVAAGRGSRMGDDGPPKQYRLLAGLPVLIRSLQVFEAAAFVTGITVVVPPGDEDRCREMLDRYGVRKVAALVPGGAERQDSVRAGLEKVAPCELVAVHDAARPFLKPAHLEAVVKAAAATGAAALAVRPRDTVKVAAGNGDFVTPPREAVWLLQTPQVFRYGIITAAHRRAVAEGWRATDDITLVEMMGHRVEMVEGDHMNFKITAPGDMRLAARLTEAGLVRVGMGYDVHPLVFGRRLVLGGVQIPYELGLDGHSDADVLVHAVMDALLGAAGLGDIGRHFPDTDARYRDASSIALLARVAGLLREHGYRAAHIDAVLVAERPKLAPYIEDMRANIGRAAGIAPAAVNIKATTTEGLGFTGKGEGIAAYAVCGLAVL
ncbi:MAG: 2-C-methyl-D-erythritol 4-phosphate cytidylyltransferase [Desulfotomaculales bacterium]